jgi:hypothetical protein
VALLSPPGTVLNRANCQSPGDTVTPKWVSSMWLESIHDGEVVSCLPSVWFGVVSDVFDDGAQ